MTNPDSGHSRDPEINKSENLHRSADDAATVSRRGQSTTPRNATAGASRVEEVTNQSGQEAWIGTDRADVSNGNTAWGAIIAGVFTFLALLLILGLGAAALGLQAAGGWALGLWTLIGLVIAFLVAGYITGALAVRSGLLNGFLTWAVSVISVIFLTGWLGTSILTGVTSAIGGVADTAAQTVSVDGQQAGDAAEGAASNVDQQDVNQAQQQADEAADEAAQTAQEAAPEVGAGIWWTLLGLIAGAVISALAGAAGARSVITKRKELTTAER